MEAKSLLNKGGKVQILGMKRNVPIACAVEVLSTILEKLPVRTIIKIELKYEEVLEALEVSTFGHRVNVLFQFVRLLVRWLFYLTRAPFVD